MRPEMPEMPKIDGRKLMKGVAALVLLIVALVASKGMFEYLDAQHGGPGSETNNGRMVALVEVEIIY